MVMPGASRIEGSTLLTDGTWHHVAAVLEDDGSPIVDEIKLYVDGDPEVTNSSSPSQAIDTASGHNVKIGNSAYNNYFNGFVDDARIYDRALSEAEIKILAGM